MWALINLCATPGLGSWMGGRRKTGACQLLLSILGFLMVVGWMLAKLCLGLRGAGLDIPVPAALLRHADMIGLGGGVLFGTAWIWALFTSICLVLISGPKIQGENSSEPPALPDQNHTDQP